MISSTTAAVTELDISNQLAGIIGTQNSRRNFDIQETSKVADTAQISYSAKGNLNNQLFFTNRDLLAGKQVKGNLYRISFEGKSTPLFPFNKKGNPRYITYILVTLKSQSGQANIYYIVYVGTWKSQNFPLLQVNDDTDIELGSYSNLSQISGPHSSTCQPGSYYQFIAIRTCCWKYIACPLGAGNNQSVTNLSCLSITIVKASNFILSQMFLLGILMCISVAVPFAAPVTIIKLLDSESVSWPSWVHSRGNISNFDTNSDMFYR
ncbi:hypothetical protein TrispH2_011338 [Trichoplax sp. H2]|nr:hypothetical protein TrispH2_011338 [Trichoplax sp. H2]|eukprot:RDD36605.1 hypothetical protein TrispH2_011338 [Trichoplax sp. H2]